MKGHGFDAIIPKMVNMMYCFVLNLRTEIVDTYIYKYFYYIHMYVFISIGHKSHILEEEMFKHLIATPNSVSLYFPQMSGLPVQFPSSEILAPAFLLSA